MIEALNPESAFDTFPCPQFSGSSSRRELAQTSSSDSTQSRFPKDQSGFTSAATIEKINAVAAAARELRRVRTEALPKPKGALSHSRIARCQSVEGCPRRAGRRRPRRLRLQREKGFARPDPCPQPEVAAKIERGEDRAEAVQGFQRRDAVKALAVITPALPGPDFFKEAAAIDCIQPSSP
jgi:hypothetical protein